MKNHWWTVGIGAILGALSGLGHSQVVINEVFYNAPNDLGDLEYVELFNQGAEAVDLSGWKLSKAVKFTFPKKTELAPQGFVVVCKDEKLFAKFYEGVETVGEYDRSLGNGSDKINLRNADDDLVDSVEYQDEAPWPTSPDGYSASLERICPASESNSSANWAPSILSDDYERRPSGTPGTINSVYQETLPPVIKKVAASSEDVCDPGTELTVTATVDGAKQAVLLYRVVKPGEEGEEVAVEMEGKSGARFTATIPGQDPNRIIRFRVRASAADGAVRHYPHQNEIRPALSVYVTEAVQTGDLPVAQFFNVGAEEFKRGAEYRTSASRPGRGGPGGFRRPSGDGPGGPPRFSEADRARRDAEQALRTDALASAWNGLTLTSGLTPAKRNEILSAFRTAQLNIAELREELGAAKDVQKYAESLPAQLEAVGNGLREGTSAILDEDQRKLLANVGSSRPADRERGRRGGRGGGGSMLQRFFDVERTWFEVAMNPELEAPVLDKVHPVVMAAIAKRDATELDGGGEDRRPDFRAIIELVEQQRQEMNEALGGAVGKDLFAKLALDRGAGSRFGGGGPGGRGGPGRGRGFGGPGRGNAPSVPLPPQGRSAFVYTDPDTKTTQLFDFVNIIPRKSGYKVRLHKDRLLDGMRTINIIYEADERTCLNEGLAFDLYRAAGNATQRAGYLRLIMDGKLVGYHLWFEQANGAFFRHNEIDDKGNLYKVTWQGSSGASPYTPEDKQPKRRLDVVRRYEKKSNSHDGYEDLIELVETLEGAEGDDEKMWAVIEERFDVDQVINYFAVNSLLSHWDGFFNNYFLYHDTDRKKWMMLPFDQDSTWSQRGGEAAELYEMPLNFGAEDAVRPGGRARPGPEARDGGGARDERGARGAGGGRDGGGFGARGRGGFGGRGFSWWRDGGEISKPLLANPQFRERFLARLADLTQTVFTEKYFGERITALEESLALEVRLRAKARESDEEGAVESLAGIVSALREHLAERRKFVLSQVEESAGERESEQR